MAIKLQKDTLEIKNIQIENPLMAEYLAGLPEAQREEAVIKALGVGILAEIKGEIAQFLNETEGEIGKRLANLKALYELREMRYRETSSKGLDAEKKILQALKDIQVASAFSDDEITDLSTVRGVLPRNKTGDLLIEVDGHNDVTIGLEIKLDKGVKLGQIDNRDPSAQTDTAIGQLLEMRTNRETDANAIVFDEDSMDATVAAACPNGIKYVQAVGFVVIVNTRRGDYENLAIFYSIAREMAKARFDVNTLESASVTMVIERLLYLLNDYRSVEKEVGTIKKSADKISASLTKLSNFVGITEQYLKTLLQNGKLSQEQLFNLYKSSDIELTID
jgi:hypothetical protein